MSVDPGSSIEAVYVRLLNEGTVVYRPVEAVRVGAGVVRLMMPQNYEPEDEEWEFEPGSMVRVAAKILEGKQVLVAVAAAA